MKPCECGCNEFLSEVLTKEYTVNSKSGRLAQLVENILERLLIEQADASKVPVFVRHCVVSLWDKYGGSKNAFAICVAQFQKLGYIEKGSMDKLTAKGEEAVKKHESEPDAAEKDAKYEKVLKGMKKDRKKEKAKTKAKVAAASEKEAKEAAMESQEDTMDMLGIRKLAETLRNMVEVNGKKKVKAKDGEEEKDWEDEDEEGEMEESLSDGNFDEYVEIGEGDLVRAGDGSNGKVVAISDDESTLDVQWEDGPDNGSVIRYDVSAIDDGSIAPA